MVADTDGVLLAVTMLDMNISQFLKSLGLEHLRDIFEREQVSANNWTYCVCVCVRERLTLLSADHAGRSGRHGS